jgi:hypothetical protein
MESGIHTCWYLPKRISRMESGIHRCWCLARRSSRRGRVNNSWCRCCVRSCILIGSPSLRQEGLQLKLQFRYSCCDIGVARHCCSTSSEGILPCGLGLVAVSPLSCWGCWVVVVVSWVVIGENLGQERSCRASSALCTGGCAGARRGTSCVRTELHWVYFSEAWFFLSARCAICEMSTRCFPHLLCSFSVSRVAVHNCENRPMHQ